MAAYVAMARVERGRVRTLAWDEPISTRPQARRGHDCRRRRPRPPRSRPMTSTTFGERLERLRDQVSMVTFYLTDPESWR